MNTIDYVKFSDILNKNIFDKQKVSLLANIAQHPERFLGLFRPTSPKGKLLQHLLQSHEIRMGVAFEEIIESFIESYGFKTLQKKIDTPELELDLYFLDEKNNKYYIVEQKIRDDHDSSKKKGQIDNFKQKVDVLYKRHNSSLVAIVYFIDPELKKNKTFYEKQLKELQSLYNIPIELFYGKELFEYFRHPEDWDNIIDWMMKWKASLPELPEIDCDSTPQQSYQELKTLGYKDWKKLLENDALWEAGTMKALFRNGATLKLLLQDFRSSNDKRYEELSLLLAQRLKTYYP